MKNLFFLFFLIVSAENCVAQNSERILLPGQITAPEESELEGTTIYNQNSKQGTISDKEGRFSISVFRGDTLVISAIQFQPFILIVTQKHLEEGFLEVPISLGLNQLPEVVVKPHNLSGNLTGDIEEIVVIKPNFPERMNFSDLKDINFPADAQSTVENVAIKKPAAGGINFIAIIGGIISAILPEKEEPEVKINPRIIHTKLRERFEDDFFEDYLSIKKEKIMPFLYFVEDNWKEDELLQENRKLDLIQFLIEQSKKFKVLTDKE